MSESEIVLPLDETIWDHVEHMEGSIGIAISEDKTLDLLGALYDIYHVSKDNLQEAQELIIGLTALLVAAPLGQANKVWLLWCHKKQAIFVLGHFCTWPVVHFLVWPHKCWLESEPHLYP